MKKTITISVDVDAWSRASEKVDNLSKYLNDCLIGLGGKTSHDRTMEQLEAEIESYRETIKDMSVKESIVLEAIKSLKFEKLERDKALIELEQYNRWICPVCKHQNFMVDDPRCTGCNLKTRHESKTEIINIKGDAI